MNKKIFNLKKINSIIKYFGGKGTMYKKILENFPQEYSIYIEPFGGSYVVGLNQSCKIEIYNDLEQNVYSLFKVLSNKTLFEQFKFLCDITPYCSDLRKECKDNLKNEDLDILSRSYNFFIVNRLSHNGIGGLSVNTIVRRNMSKSVSDFLSTIDKLPEFHQRISNLIVLNQDGIELIEKYSDNENVFIYCDPPYEHSTRTNARYKQDMNNEHHIKFINTVLKCKCKILISGYDCDLYNVLTESGRFKKINFVVNTISGTFKSKTKVETLWKNY